MITPKTIWQWLTRILVTVVVLALLSSGYFWLRSAVAVGIYQERLADLSRDYETLRARHNDAVRKTAVTELVVEDGRLSARIRTADGLVATIETPYDPAGEIYVDYVVYDSRLWIRRIFDAQTPPRNGILIDPRWGHVDWESDRATLGKAVYRQLGQGIWTVAVSGDGSLTLTRWEGGDRMTLSPPPEIRDYEQIQKTSDNQLRAIGPGELIRRLDRD